MLPTTSNPEPTHTHYFIFNDDGFEVCNKCGICTTLRHLEPGLIIQEPANNYRSEFADVLINNHIGYVDTVEKEYKKIKSKLLRGTRMFLSMPTALILFYYKIISIIL